MMNLVSLPYEIARLPLSLIDSKLSDKLPENQRLTLDRAIGSADRLAGTVLGNRDLAKRGTARLERSAKVATAVRLEEEAETRREQAREKAAEGRRKATQKRKAAQERATRGLDEADAAEARGKQEAKAKAEKSAAQKKAAADRKASARTAQAEQRNKRVATTAETKRKAVQTKAQSELDEARATKQEAAKARADAERLSDLADAKKQERKQD
jgi:hypothetical protein